MFESDIVHILLTMFHLCGSFSAWKSFFWKSCILMKFEFLSTVVNQGTIIRIENIFIVNKIDKFNVSGFRNTQARFQRTSKSREPFDLRHVQIHDFLTLICRIDRTPLKPWFRVTPKVKSSLGQKNMLLRDPMNRFVSPIRIQKKKTIFHSIFFLRDYIFGGGGGSVWLN